MKPAQYWRDKQIINDYLGKTGQVVANTVIRTTSPELSHMAPYSYVIVDFSGIKKEMMGVGNEVLVAGDSVVCVIRRMGLGDLQGLIDYGLKVKKIME
ncbi:MAG: hypothetical protein GW942_01545 [Candidatus Pacebacteria bacterium]|nr:hypothetical protein [Candidatus Paceibacterota bacterium]